MKLNFIIKMGIIIILLVVLLKFLPITFSKYETKADGNAIVNYAFYILEANYYKEEIMLDSIVPSNDSYIYNFSVSNYSDTKRCDTDLEYDLWITTTTNLDLEYDLILKNETAVVSNEVIADEYGTYFRNITTNKEMFSHKENMINEYSLIVKFPTKYKDSKYQDIVDSVTINIESKQVIDE